MKGPFKLQQPYSVFPLSEYMEYHQFVKKTQFYTNTGFYLCFIISIILVCFRYNIFYYTTRLGMTIDKIDKIDIFITTLSLLMIAYVVASRAVHYKKKVINHVIHKHHGRRCYVVYERGSKMRHIRNIRK